MKGMLFLSELAQEMLLLASYAIVGEEDDEIGLFQQLLS